MMDVTPTEADGGVDESEYEIDLAELEFDVENRTRDSTNNVTYKLARIEDTDLWVSYSSSQTGPSEVATSIKGIGRLSTSGVELDTDVIADALREKAEDRQETGDDRTETDDKIQAVADHADELAEVLADEWAHGAEIVVDEAIYDGMAAVSGRKAWSGHVEEALYYEVEDGLRTVGLEEDDHGIVADVAKQSLYAGVQELRDRWLKPHLEYEVELEFEIEPWELRAIELQQNSVLPEKTARVWALKESGKRNAEVADELGIDASTVTRQVSRAERMIEESEWTVENAA